jgi:hypothetical protein
VITLTDYFYLVVFNKWDERNVITLTSDNIKRLSLYKKVTDQDLKCSKTWP